jgi:hypothetical protein
MAADGSGGSDSQGKDGDRSSGLLAATALIHHDHSNQEKRSLGVEVLDRLEGVDWAIRKKREDLIG